MFSFHSVGIETSARQISFQAGLIFIFLMQGYLEPEIVSVLALLIFLITASASSHLLRSSRVEACRVEIAYELVL